MDLPYPKAAPQEYLLADCVRGLLKLIGSKSLLRVNTAFVSWFVKGRYGTNGQDARFFYANPDVQFYALRGMSDNPWGNNL